MILCRRFARDFLLTQSPVEVSQTTVDMQSRVFTPNFVPVAKISLLEEQRLVATVDSVGLVSFALMLGG